MEDELILKEKYNDLLESFKKGTEYLEQHPNEQDKIQKRLDEITKEISNIMDAIPNMTEDEKVNGFKIEKQDAQIVENASYKKQDAQMQVIIKQDQISLEESFSNDWQMATQLAKSDILPDNYKNKPQNVVIAVGLARQMNLPPFTVMQNLAIIRGKTSWSGSFAKTLIERTGKFRDLELNYIGEKGKDSYGCYLSAIRISDGKIIKGPEVTMKMAKDEGWTSNKKWLTLTELMLAYRCQSFFCRIYCPEAMNGIYTSEEIEDITPNREQPIDVL